ncbi:hypothetical protein ACFSKM_27085 [Ancylobacter dichloromethanicus]
MPARRTASPTRRHLRLRAGAALLAAALWMAGLGAAPARAQTPAPADAGNQPAPKQRIEQLDAELKQSTAAQQRLASEVKALEGDRAKLNEALLDTAIRVRETEAKLDVSEQRLLQLGREADDIRESLDARRAVLAEVLGGLVRLGRRPPPALLVRPDDALQSIRSAMLLGAVLPELEGRDRPAGQRTRRAGAGEAGQRPRTRRSRRIETLPRR